MRFQRQSNGQVIIIDPNSVLGVGGEARIYALPQEPSLVAKVYHKPTDEKAHKLSVMFTSPPDDPMSASGLASIAWPVDLLHTTYDRWNQIAGFLMPRVIGMRAIINFYNPGVRRRQCPLFSYLYLHRTARNLASAVHALHVRGYVIGDVNESNILVSDTALVTLVDTDSFQVWDPQRGVVYHCPVGKPEFTPPELQGKLFVNTDRLPEHDRFGLAVLIFQLLMEGIHPFAGIFQGGGDPPPYEERISSGHFPYGMSQRVPYRPARNAPPFEILHPNLRQLFLQCFEDGYKNPQMRPDARTWQDALNEAENDLVTCSANDQHRYGGHLRACPWCERSARLRGRDPFPSREVVKNGKHLRSITPIRKPPQRQTIIVPRPPSPASIYSRIVQRQQPQPRRIPYRYVAIIQVLPFLIIVFFWLFEGREKVLPPRIYVPIPLLTSDSSPQLKILRGPLRGPQGPVLAVAFSSDGKTLAGGSADRRIRFWEVRTGAFLGIQLKHQGDVNALAFSPDGATLASGSLDKTIRLWDAHTGKWLAILRGHESYVNSVAFSPDGTTLASGSSDRTIRLWDVRTGQLIQTLKGYGGDIYSVVYSPDGKILASGSSNGTIQLWDTQSGRQMQTLSGHEGYVNSVAFSPDGKTLASGSQDKTVRFWNTQTGQLQQTLKQHKSDVYSVAFSPDGKTLVSGSKDKTVRLRDVQTGELLQTFEGHKEGVTSVAFSPDGKTLASGSQDKTMLILIWDAKTEAKP